MNPPLPRARVTIAHVPPREEPLRVFAGDPLAIGEEDTEYPGWFRAAAPSGRSAWIPEAYVRINGSSGIALREYDSSELEAVPGDEVTLLLEYRGWVWAESPRGSGWLPLEKIEILH